MTILFTDGVEWLPEMSRDASETDETGKSGEPDGATESVETDRPGAAAERSEHGRPCPQCGATLIHRHCEYVCPNHGVIMDCADTFY